jgi:pyridoxine 5-phosphate synthase
MAANPPIRLGVNIDHVATVRNARGGRHPDPVKAAEIAIAAGADGITAHLREDRRHIVDDDIVRLKERITKPLNFEMAATPEMVGIACKVRPHAACIVPERRAERTTEGGLDAAGQREGLRETVGKLTEADIRVSLFIAAEPAQIEAAAAIGAPVIEIHTGAWCEAVAAGDAAVSTAEFERIVRGAKRANGIGLEVHAGHGLDFVTAAAIAALPEIDLRRPRRRGSQDARGDESRPAQWRSRGMILGIGSDISDVRRIAKVIERHGDRFIDRIFTPHERARAERRRNRVETYAKRFAAKEACAKALGTGIRAGVWWRDMGVVNLPSGRPTMELTGGAKRRLEAITPKGYEARIDLTITDEGPTAHAFVIISAVAVTAL